MSLLHAMTLLIIRENYVARGVSIPNSQGVVVIVLVPVPMSVGYLRCDVVRYLPFP